MLGGVGPVHGGPDFAPGGVPNGTPKGRRTGTTELVMGPMFSGKTETGFQRVRSAIMGGKRAVIIKHSTDTRYTKKPLASSHDGFHMRALVVETLEHEPLGLPLDVELIFVDEGM